MPYGYYVKAGGTASGSGGRVDLTTPRSGTWNATASEYYDTIGDALSAAPAPVSGDLIIFSDASSDVTTGTTHETLPEGVSLWVVSDSNQDTYTPALLPQIDNADGDSYRVHGTDNARAYQLVAGINITTGFPWSHLNSSANIMMDSVITLNQNASNYLVRSAGHQTYLNTDFEWSSGKSGSMQVGDSGSLSFNGGEISTRAGSGSVFAVITADGPDVICTGVDFSNNSANLNIVTFGSSASNNATRVILIGCPLYSGWSSNNLNMSINNSLSVIECDSRYQYYIENYNGSFDFITDIYYTNHDTLDDGLTKGSYEVTTSSNVLPSSPLMISSAFHTAVLSAVNTEAASKKKVRLRFVAASGDTLDDSDVVVWVFYPDIASSYNRRLVTHWKSPLKTGAALATETGAWTDNSGSITLGTQYYLDIDMGNPDNGRVNVVPGVCKPNVTVYFSWQLEFVA